MKNFWYVFRSFLWLEVFIEFFFFIFGKLVRFDRGIFVIRSRLVWSFLAVFVGFGVGRFGGDLFVCRFKREIVCEKLFFSFWTVEGFG